MKAVSPIYLEGNEQKCDENYLARMPRQLLKQRLSHNLSP